jgi:hypothetical protein
MVIGEPAGRILVAPTRCTFLAKAPVMASIAFPGPKYSIGLAVPTSGVTAGEFVSISASNPASFKAPKIWNASLGGFHFVLTNTRILGFANGRTSSLISARSFLLSDRGSNAATICASFSSACSAALFALNAAAAATLAEFLASPASLVTSARSWSDLFRSSEFLVRSWPFICVIHRPTPSSPRIPKLTRTTLAISRASFPADGLAGGRIIPLPHNARSSLWSCNTTMISIATPTETNAVNKGNNLSQHPEELSRAVMELSNADI